MLDNYRLTPEIQRYPRSETWDRTQKYADLYTRFSLVKKKQIFAELRTYVWVWVWASQQLQLKKLDPHGLRIDSQFRSAAAFI